jgi:hypothetical protein
MDICNGGVMSTGNPDTQANLHSVLTGLSRIQARLDPSTPPLTSDQDEAIAKGLKEIDGFVWDLVADTEGS